MDSSRVDPACQARSVPVAVCDIAGLLRSEVHRRGAVRVCDGRRCRVALAPCSRESLRRLQHGAGLVVVDSERPEVLYGNIRGQGHFVSLGTVEVVFC